MKLVNKLALFLIVAAPLSVVAHDILLEFKGAYFHPTSSRFRKIYHGGALYGPELTFQLCDEWYGFASADFFHKKGLSIGLETSTSICLVPIGFGLKYLRPSCFECIDWYVGLGFQSVNVSIENNSSSVPDHSKWAFGGIAKAGMYIDLSCKFFLDLFVDYSFVNLCSVRTQTCCGPVTPLKTNIGGVIVGAGLGYRF